MVAVSSFGPGTGFAGANSGGVPEAFGHGYSRQDLRSLVHLCAPCSLEQYAQEVSLLAGGRPEGENTVALMLYNPAHLALNLALLNRKRPSPEVLDAVLNRLLAFPANSWIEETDLDDGSGTSPRSISLVLDFLADAKAIERERNRAKTALPVRELKSAVKNLKKAFIALSEGDPGRLEEVESYALSDGCRDVALARILGHDAPAEDCGRCDSCAPDALESGIEEERAHGSRSPTIETRASKRRAPVRYGQGDEEQADEELADEEFVGDLDSLEA
jgi:superfamily II DNA helicase RecQ